MSVRLNVDVRFWGVFSGEPKIFEVQGKTVGECLNQLVEKEPAIKSNIFDKSGEPTGVVFLCINQVPLFMRRLDKEVKDGDEVGVIFGGGG